jgi:predicted DCC family thiol-disulfide oxidoreductase YuxK
LRAHPPALPRSPSLDHGSIAPVVLYDGDCGVCQRVADRLSTRHGEGVAVWRPWQGEPSLPAGLTQKRLEREIVMVAPGGALVGGHRVFAHLLQRTRGWRALGLLIALPGPGLLARLVYRLVAARRRWLSRRLGLNACRVPRRSRIN